MKPNIILLGLCDRVVPSDSLAFDRPVTFEGLRRSVVSPIFPLDLRNFFLAIATPQLPLSGTFRLKAPPAPEYSFELDTRAESGARELPHGHVAFGLSLRNIAPPLIWEPCVCDISFETSGEISSLGSLEFVYSKPDPLTADQIAAIRSNPSLNRALRFNISCNRCSKNLSTFYTLDPTMRDHADLQAAVWYADLPDYFNCSCGDVTIPLRYLREALPSMLATTGFLPDGSLQISERRTSMVDVDQTLGEFSRLLDTEPNEELVQKFIEQHVIMLAPFAAARLFFKPPILTKFKADFGIVNSRRELWLIEIEKPGMKLLKADGTQTANLTKAFSQPQAWKFEIDQDPRAAFRCIPDCDLDILRVRYLVIAGRSQGADAAFLDRLVRSQTEPEFMTYDQLMGEVRDSAQAAVSGL